MSLLFCTVYKFYTYEQRHNGITAQAYFFQLINEGNWMYFPANRGALKKKYIVLVLDKKTEQCQFLQNLLTLYLGI